MKPGRSGPRPLAPVTTQPPAPGIAELQSSPAYADACTYFSDYPERSLMSDESRAVLYSLIRTLRPTYIAEIGTFQAGTTEVMARAAWENDWGIVYTTDPFGGERCPRIISKWPKELRKYASFHPLSSMDFFRYLDQRRVSLDLTLIDGDHDYEAALFDLQMAARRTRPSGIVVMDNAEQSGPFTAARTYLSLNPGWRELGRAVADHDPLNPFDACRASIPGTGFILLQAPSCLSVGEGPRSWGQVPMGTSRVRGLVFTLAGGTAGTLHFQVICRAFFSDGAAPVETKAIGRVRIDSPGPAALAHRFDEPLELPAGALCTIETDLSWQADAGAPPLGLAKAPEPLES